MDMCSHVDGEHLVLGMLVFVAASEESEGGGGWMRRARFVDLR